MTELTWDVVSGLNANHAREQRDVTKAAALELLKQNSRAAATAVRSFCNDELDRAGSLWPELWRACDRSVRHRRSRFEA